MHQIIFFFFFSLKRSQQLNSTLINWSEEKRERW